MVITQDNLDVQPPPPPPRARYRGDRRYDGINELPRGYDPTKKHWLNVPVMGNSKVKTRRLMVIPQTPKAKTVSFIAKGKRVSFKARK